MDASFYCAFTAIRSKISCYSIARYNPLCIMQPGHVSFDPCVSLVTVGRL